MSLVGIGIGTLSPPLSPASVPLPSEPRGEGHTRLRVRGWGSPNFDDWRKSLALCLLCGWNSLSYARQIRTTVCGHYPITDETHIVNIGCEKACSTVFVQTV